MADPGRTEPATPRRKQEARRRGQVARSPELTAAILLLAILAYFNFMGGDMFSALQAEARGWWGSMGPRELGIAHVAAAGLAVTARSLLMLAPLFLVVILVAVGANVMQFGMVFSSFPIQPKPDNINPAQGFKRIFSQPTVANLMKSLLKIALIGWVLYAGISGSFAEIVRESTQPVGVAFATAANLSFRLGLKIALVLLAIAILDYLYQRYAYERNLRMTRQEVRDEYKQMEGDPLVKARIRQLQRDVARRRMISEIPKADVVITNPVHLAIAIKYDINQDQAPQILAKGARLIAERIKEVARQNGVPIYEDPPLARALYQVPVNGSLPEALYQAVAQVLAFVYHANQKDKERRILGDVTARLAKETVSVG